MVFVTKDRASEKVLFYERIKDVEARLGRSCHLPNSFILCRPSIPSSLGVSNNEHVLFMTCRAVSVSAIDHKSIFRGIMPASRSSTSVSRSKSCTY
jgi:hypothetical protein